MELSEILKRCLEDAEFELEEGQLAGTAEKLKLAISVPDPDTSQVRLVAELGKKEAFRDIGQQFIEPLLSILKRENSTDMKLQACSTIVNA